MKAQHTLLVALFMMLGLMSCENENHFNIYQFSEEYDPNKAISSASIGIASSRSFGINGGTAPFQAQMADENVATVHLRDNEFTITPVQLGETSLVVKDSKGEIVRIGVQVTKSSQSFYIKKVDVKIEGSLSDDAKAELKKKVMDDSDILVDDVVIFTYDKRTSGAFATTSSKGVATSVAGTFRREIEQAETSARISFYMTYKGNEHVFYLGEYPREEVAGKTVRDIGPLYYSFNEDVTDVYKNEYPGVTSVERLCSIMTHLMW